MPLSPPLLVALVLIFGLSMGLVLILVGLIWSHVRALPLDRTTRLVDTLERRQEALEALLARVETPEAKPPLSRSGSARDPVSRRRVDPAMNASAEGPTLIAVPNLAAGPLEGPAHEAAAELARRFGAIWALADSGASVESIARGTGQPIGQVELILALRRQLATATIGERA